MLRHFLSVVVLADHTADLLAAGSFASLHLLSRSRLGAGSSADAPPQEVSLHSTSCPKVVPVVVGTGPVAAGSFVLLHLLSGSGA